MFHIERSQRRQSTRYLALMESAFSFHQITHYSINSQRPKTLRVYTNKTTAFAWSIVRSFLYCILGTHSHRWISETRNTKERRYKPAEHMTIKKTLERDSSIAPRRISKGRTTEHDNTRILRWRVHIHAECICAENLTVNVHLSSLNRKDCVEISYMWTELKRVSGWKPKGSHHLVALKWPQHRQHR